MAELLGKMRKMLISHKEERIFCFWCVLVAWVFFAGVEWEGGDRRHEQKESTKGRRDLMC